jgi:hypothetical protein
VSTRAKSWSLAAAKEMLPDVRVRTQRAVAEVERLEAARDSLPPGTEERAAIEAEIEEAVQRWAREMEALGLDVKGLWLVDFDSGAGYYCWTWPEAELSFFHGYEEGFGGRARIQ